MAIVEIFNYLSSLDQYLWSYLAIPLIIVIGVYLTIQFRFSHFFKFNTVFKTFFETAKDKKTGDGVHPLHAFFASMGGCIGIGNIVAVCTAIHIGGPGAIFWMWMVGLIGMGIKYSEIYLGVIYRVPNGKGGYDGGPMYYLQKIMKNRFVPILFAALLSGYGTEVYMFNVMTHSVKENWHINHYLVVAFILLLVIYSVKGGVGRVGKIASVIIPVFIILFSSMSLWILGSHFKEIPGMFYLILKSAFTGHAPIGGFAGSSLMLAMSQGVARACYSGDIGVGYASIVHAETSSQNPKKQAQLSIFGIFLDTFVIGTFTTLLILITGVWNQDIPASLMVQKALENYFPYMNYFMPTLLFTVGYSTLIAFFCVGLKCAQFIHPKKGKIVYYIYAIISFVAFSFVDQNAALTVMSIFGGILLSINLVGIHRLRSKIEAF